MRRVLGVLAIAALAWSCGDDGSPTGPSSNVCSEVALGPDPGDFFIRGCSSTEVSISNIQYDRFDNVSSYNFNAYCSSTGKRYTGSVNSQARTATVNGQRCSF
ncbi:MAG: hypothetical protein OXH69_10565 [Acidobacteria bacterium]|nr:hypothetical protein [Acidobacteriota bacterium]